MLKPQRRGNRNLYMHTDNARCQLYLAGRIDITRGGPSIILSFGPTGSALELQEIHHIENGSREHQGKKAYQREFKLFQA